MGDDVDLLARLRVGDGAAFTQLVGRHHRWLVHAAVSMTDSRELAEDAVQDTWVSVLRGLTAFRGDSSLRTWMFRILVNEVHSGQRRERRSEPTIARSARIQVAMGDGLDDGWEDAVDERISAHATARRLTALLPRLPGAQREAVVLHDIEGFTNDAVARCLGVSVGYERVLLHRGRARLRTLFRDDSIVTPGGSVTPLRDRSSDLVEEGNAHPSTTEPTMTERTQTQMIDETKLEQLMHQMVGYMTGGAICFAIWIGDELGFYRVLAGGEPMTAQQVATATGCNERLVREWLDGQAAGHLIDYDPLHDVYRLSAEEAAALAEEDSPAFVARAMNALGSFFLDADKVMEAYRGDGALAWGDHHPCLFSGTEWLFRAGYRSMLPGWLDAIDGLDATLRRGGSIADVGCGHGASVVVLADTYPNATVTGIDNHAASIEVARRRADEAGVDDRSSFVVADSRSYDGTYDLICFFDCLHDMGDPVGAARHAREHLTDDGVVMLVEPFALDGRATNMADNPMSALFYTASSAICAPNSLSQDVGLALGAQAGEERLSAVMSEAGYSTCRRVAETPMNLILEARA